MGKLRQIFTELSARDTPIFSFPDDNWSKVAGNILIIPQMLVVPEVYCFHFSIAISLLISGPVDGFNPSLAEHNMSCRSKQ